jgi:hypothetical protein
MSTFFSQITKSFADVPIGADNGIDTVTFLAAAEDLVKLFGASFEWPFDC